VIPEYIINMKRISIIIVTYNSEKDIYDCIDSIYQHADIPVEEIEIIVVDNMSREVDVMFARLNELYNGRIVLIKNSKNGGYGQGNNVGIMQSSAPVILIMNPDVRQTMPFLKKPLETFNKRNEITMYGMKQMLTPTIASTNSINVSNSVNGYFSTLCSGICNRFDLFFPNFMYLNGACFFIRKDMFTEIGLFDESIFMYGEENDIFHRIKKRFGSKVIYDTSIRYLHLTSERVVTFESEDKILRSLISSNEKNGCPPQRTITNKIRGLNVLIIKERLACLMGNRLSKQKIRVYKEYKEHLTNLLSEYKK